MTWSHWSGLTGRRWAATTLPFPAWPSGISCLQLFIPILAFLWHVTFWRRWYYILLHACACEGMPLSASSSFSSLKVLWAEKWRVWGWIQVLTLPFRNCNFSGPK